MSSLKNFQGKLDSILAEERMKTVRVDMRRLLRTPQEQPKELPCDKVPASLMSHVKSHGQLQLCQLVRPATQGKQ